MSDLRAACSTITANPDVSGIGVRIAIYAQNLLSFIPALWALKDGRVTPTELGELEKQSTTILIHGLCHPHLDSDTRFHTRDF